MALAGRLNSNSADGAMLSPQATQLESYSGVFVDLAGPDPMTIRLRDVAQGLALTCRYGGHVSRFYSVAEHAVLVHDLLAVTRADPALLVAALFHDAAAAYLGDVVAPLKYALRGAGRRVSAYDELTSTMELAIIDRFGIERDFDDEAIRLADMWALRIEARSLPPTSGIP